MVCKQRHLVWSAISPGFAGKPGGSRPVPDMFCLHSVKMGVPKRVCKRFLATEFTEVAEKKTQNSLCALWLAHFMRHSLKISAQVYSVF